MVQQYYMRGFNTVTLQYIDWVVNDQPDSAGTYSGVSPPSNLANIVVNKTVSSKVNNFLKPNESLGGTDGYFLHINSYDWLHSTPPGPPIPVPTNISGMAVVRGSVDGVTPRDYATLFWNEGAQGWRLAFNTNGDGTTVGASLPLEVSSAQADNFISIGTTPALSGVIRMPTITTINSRSNNNTRDISLIGTDSSDHILIGDASDTTIIQGNLTVLGVTTTVDSTTIDIVGRVIHANWSTAANVSPPSLVAGYSIHRGAASGVANDGAALIWTEGTQTVTGSDGYWRFATLSQDNDNISPSSLANILDIMAGSLAVTSSPNPTAGSLPGVGGLRTQNNTTAVSARNAAGNADLLLLGSDGSNHAVIGTLAGNGSGFVAVSNTGALSFTTAPGPGGAAGGDLSGTYPNPLVAGISGASPLPITTPILQWIMSPASPPTIKQTALTTNSGTGNAFTVQAQNATGTTSIGGALILTSGSGTSTNGAVDLQIGGTTTASLVTNKFVFNAGRRRHVTTISSAGGTQTLAATNDYVAITTLAVPFQINLPSSPTTGDEYLIKDTTGNAGTNNVIISGNGSNIDGASTFVFTSAFESATFTFNGTTWSIS